jgi:beta-carotene 3-hydroxylase
MAILIYLIVIICAFMFMEFYAWFMHKYVMHGFLWLLHEDHHRYHEHRLEKNDLFTLFFSSIAVALIYCGTVYAIPLVLSLGIGVTLYGMCYFAFHDVMFHRRIRFIKLKPWTKYLKRIVNAHATHHQKFYQQQGVAFGFLFASGKYDTV